MQDLLATSEKATMAAAAARQSVSAAREAIFNAFPAAIEKARSREIVAAFADQISAGRDAVDRSRADIKRASAQIQKLTKVLPSIDATEGQDASAAFFTASEIHKTAVNATHGANDKLSDALAKAKKAKAFAEEAINTGPNELERIPEAKATADQAQREVSAFTEAVEKVHHALQSKNATTSANLEMLMGDALGRASQSRAVVNDTSRIYTEVLAGVTQASPEDKVREAAAASVEAFDTIQSAVNQVFSLITTLGKLGDSFIVRQTAVRGDAAVAQLLHDVSTCVKEIGEVERHIDMAVTRTAEAEQRANTARDTPAADPELLRAAEYALQHGSEALDKAISGVLNLAQTADKATGLGRANLERLSVITNEADRVRLKLEQSAEAFKESATKLDKSADRAETYADRAEKALKGILTHTTVAVNREKAARDAEILVEYAARHSVDKIELNDEMAVITYARALDEKRSISVQEEANFWSAFRRLTAAIRPATVESVRERLAFDRGERSGLGSAGVASVWTLIVVLSVTLLIHMYFSVLDTLIKNAETARGNFISIKADFLEDRIQYGDAASRMCEQEYAWRGSLGILDVWTVLLDPSELWLWNGTRESLPETCPWLARQSFNEGEQSELPNSDTDSERRGPERPLSGESDLDHPLIPSSEQLATAQLSGDDALLVKAVALRSVISQFFLPLLYGWLGALAYGLRNLANEMRSVSFSKATRQEQRMRVPLGILAGATVGLLIRPETLSTLQGLTSIGIAFGLGFAVDLFFDFLEGLMNRLKGTPPAPPNDGAAHQQRPGSG